MANTVDKYQKVLYDNIDRFPEIMMNNDYKIKWVYGEMYTFEPLMGHVLNYGEAVVIYQELEVIHIAEDGTRSVIGKTVYTNMVEGGELLHIVNEFEESPDYRQGGLSESLRRAMDERIKELREGTEILGCEFVTNQTDVLLNEEDVLKEIVKRFRKRMEDFFVDILLKEEFKKGIYRIDVDGIEIGYQDVDGWGVMLVLNIQHYKTLSKREVTLIYPTNVKETSKAPKLETIRKYIKREVERFVESNKKSVHFGVEFRFMEIYDVQREADVYSRIRGDKEEVDFWASRMATVLGNNKERLQEILSDIEVKDSFGFHFKLKTGHVLVFSSGGAILDDGRVVYIKKDMNLQEGLRNLSKVLGKSKVTLEIMKTYDSRSRIKEVDKGV